MATGINANPWNISMDKDFNERFETYRQQFIKVHGISLTKSEFGRFIFETWEKRYLDLIVEIEKKTDELNTLIEKDTKELNSLTPGLSKVG